MTIQSARASATKETVAVVEAIAAPRIGEMSRGYLLEAIKAQKAHDGAAEKASNAWVRVADSLHADGISSEEMKEKKGPLIEEFKAVVFSGMPHKVQVAIDLPAASRSELDKLAVKNAQSAASTYKGRVVQYLLALENAAKEAELVAAGATPEEIEEAAEQSKEQKVATKLLGMVQRTIEAAQKVESAPFDLTALVAELNKALAIIVEGGK